MEQNEIVKLGASLRQIDRASVKQLNDKAVTKLWYQGGEPYFDVFFELQDSKIIWFQFTLRGKSVSWSRQSAQLETGITNESNIDDITYYAASKLIRTNHKTDLSFVQLVKSILQIRAGEPVFDQALLLLSSAAAD